MSEEVYILEDDEHYLPPPKGEWLISTWDNPWNPFDHEREWMAFDERRGYCTNGLIARLMRANGYTTSLYLEEEDDESISLIMRKIVTMFPNIWRFVEKGKKTEVRKLDGKESL